MTDKKNGNGDGPKLFGVPVSMLNNITFGGLLAMVLVFVGYRELQTDKELSNTWNAMRVELEKSNIIRQEMNDTQDAMQRELAQNSKLDQQFLVMLTELNRELRSRLRAVEYKVGIVVPEK